MFRGEKIVAKIDENKTLIWGLFLSSQILGHAIGSMFLVILSGIFLFTVAVRKKIVFKKNLFPLYALFFWGAFSVFWTTYLPTTFSGIGKTTGLLVLPLAVSQYSVFTLKDLRKIINIFSLSLILYFVVCLCKSFFLFLEDGQINHFFYHDLVSIFKNSAIYISLFTGVCIIIKANIPQKTTFDKVIISALMLFLLLLASKNLIISTFLLLGISLVFSKKEKTTKKSVFITLSIVLLGFIGLFMFENPIKERFLDETDTNLTEVWNKQDFSDFEFNGSNLRIFQWRVVYEMIENNQIGFLGLGLDNINYLTEQYFNYYNAYQGYMALNFHNQYLQTLGELGFIGLGILIFLFCFSLYRALKLKNKFLFLITLLFILCFLTESYLCRQKGVMLVSALFSVLLSYHQSVYKKEQ